MPAHLNFLTSLQYNILLLLIKASFYIQKSEVVLIDAHEAKKYGIEIPEEEEFKEFKFGMLN